MTTAIKERGILFGAPMVRALLEGRKTQTRRMVKGPLYFAGSQPAIPDSGKGRCPYGQPGDRLWVRETWRYADWTEDGQPWIAYKADGAKRHTDDIPDDWEGRLVDIWAELSEPANYNIDNCAADRKWRPSLFMPRWASRITLEITDVRVERVDDISEEDAKAEGLLEWTDPPRVTQKHYGATVADVWETDPRKAFLRLFYDINKRAQRESNPWVWALTFKNLEAK